MRNLVLIATLTSFAAPASAHEGHDHAAAMDAQTLTTSAGWRMGSFDFDATSRGHYQTLSVAVTWAPTQWLRLQAATPWSYLRLADGRGAVGLGDVSADTSLLMRRGRWTTTAGLAMAAPTGDPDVGIGSGHFELTPHIAARYATSRLTFESSAAQQTALGNDEDDGVPHGALLAPHSRHETHVTFSGTASVGNVDLGISGRGVVTHDLPMGGTTARTFVAWSATENWTVGADFSVPVSGFKRYAWRSGVLVHFNW